MSGIGKKLPIIELIRLAPDGVTVLPGTDPSTDSQINVTFGYLYGITRFDVDWPPQIAGEDELADHSIVQNIQGYRFTLSLSFSNRYLSTALRGSVEDVLHQMSGWTVANSFNRIRVYPHQDRLDLHYYCYIPAGGYVKKKAVYSDGLKTLTHDWDITLIGISLLSQKPSTV